MVPRLPEQGRRDLKQVAVTGASGYLGSRLVRALDAGGAVVVPVVRKAVPYLPAAAQVELDLLSAGPALVGALDGADAIVHLAGHNEVVAAQEPERALAETLLATQRVVQAAMAAGVDRLVYLSTVHVYGTQLAPGARIDEDTCPTPRAGYAIARLASEHLAAQAADGGVEVVVLRLTNGVGAPAHPAVNRWTLVATDLCRQAVRTGELVLHSSGQQWRDFVALTDVCDAIGRSADPDGGIAPGTFNLASGQPLTVRGIAELVQDRFEERTGTRPALRTAPPIDDPPAAYTVSPDLLAAAGWRASSSVADGVDELVAFCIDNKEDLTRG